MTDEARAQAVCLVLLGESGVTPEAVATLAGEFAAVRRQEQ